MSVEQESESKKSDQKESADSNPSEPSGESAKPRTSTRPRSLPPGEDEYYEDEEANTGWRIGIWVLSILLGLVMIGWGAASIYQIVKSLHEGYRLTGMSFVHIGVCALEVIAGVLLFVPRLRFTAALGIVVALFVNFAALRPPQIPGRSWFYMNAFFIVFAGIIALKSMPPALAARFRKNDEDEPPPVF